MNGELARQEVTASALTGLPGPENLRLGGLRNPRLPDAPRSSHGRNDMSNEESTQPVGARNAKPRLHTRRSAPVVTGWRPSLGEVI